MWADNVKRVLPSVNATVWLWKHSDWVCLCVYFLLAMLCSLRLMTDRLLCWQPASTPWCSDLGSESGRYGYKYRAAVTMTNSYAVRTFNFNTSQIYWHELTTYPGQTKCKPGVWNSFSEFLSSFNEQSDCFTRTNSYPNVENLSVSCWIFLFAKVFIHQVTRQEIFFYLFVYST